MMWRIMDPSYSLHARIPEKPKFKKQRRKRKLISICKINSYKYTCYSCFADVYFLPGHELVCRHCSSRIVQKVSQGERIVSAR